MPKEILTRCGYRCDLCLAYKDNIETGDQREFLSDTWHKIYGFRIPAQEIYCEGCISCDNPKLIDNKCPVRPCVIEKGLENCSQCKDYPCELFNQRKVTIEDFSKGKTLSRKEYSKCIKPYENKKRLDEIRKDNYPHSRLLNPEILPDYDGLLKFIGNKQIKSKWHDLLAFVDNSYDLDKKILYGGKKYGWAVQYKRSKNYHQQKNQIPILKRKNLIHCRCSGIIITADHSFIVFFSIAARIALTILRISLF